MSIDGRAYRLAHTQCVEIIPFGENRILVDSLHSWKPDSGFILSSCFDTEKIGRYIVPYSHHTLDGSDSRASLIDDGF